MAADCVLPLTGGDSRLGVLALCALVAGVALVFGVRRRGVGGGAAIVLAFALGAMGLLVGDARRADAQDCASSTTSTQTGASTTTAGETSLPTNTTAPGSATTSASTTTASTTTSPTPTATPIPPVPTTVATTTTSSSTTTSSTTTTLAVPDLTPTISGPGAAVPDVAAIYTIDIANVGTAPTSGLMSFTLAFDIETGPNALAATPQPSTDWSFVGQTPEGLVFVSNPGFELAPNAVSTSTLRITWGSDSPGSFTMSTTLPTGIGGETNAANNSASHTVAIAVPPPDLTPAIDGPLTQGAEFPGPLYTITITNVGSGATEGPMRFVMVHSLLAGQGFLNPTTNGDSTDWTSTETDFGLVLVSKSGFVLAPGASSTVTFNLAWQLDFVGGAFKMDVILPNGIGGDVNDANNTASHTVVVIVPPG